MCTIIVTELNYLLNQIPNSVYRRTHPRRHNNLIFIYPRMALYYKQKNDFQRNISPNRMKTEPFQMVTAKYAQLLGLTCQGEIEYRGNSPLSGSEKPHFKKIFPPPKQNHRTISFCMGMSPSTVVCPLSLLAQRG